MPESYEGAKGETNTMNLKSQMSALVGLVMVLTSKTGVAAVPNQNFYVSISGNPAIGVWTLTKVKR